MNYVVKIMQKSINALILQQKIIANNKIAARYPKETLMKRINIAMSPEVFPMVLHDIDLGVYLTKKNGRRIPSR
jgi:hypothetical protein